MKNKTIKKTQPEAKEGEKCSYLLGGKPNCETWRKFKIGCFDCSLNGTSIQPTQAEGEDYPPEEEIHDLKSIIESLEIKIEKLEFMINNGLSWKDMENDITYPA